jgi:hypothetical protein
LLDSSDTRSRCERLHAPVLRAREAIVILSVDRPRNRWLAGAATELVRRSAGRIRGVVRRPGYPSAACVGAGAGLPLECEVGLAPAKPEGSAGAIPASSRAAELAPPVQRTITVQL